MVGVEDTPTATDVERRRALRQSIAVDHIVKGTRRVCCLRADVMTITN
jgi:hypothetical protein